MDLFMPIINDTQLHENFKRIANNKYLVDIISRLSVGFDIERDGKEKFIKEFQSTFNSSLWEIYCYALFNSMGCEFDFSHERPDFVLRYNSVPFNVECVITNPSDGALPEYDVNEKLNSTKSLSGIVNDQIIRLLNAMSSKYTKYHKGYSCEEWVKDKAFIIAVHAFEQAGFMKANTEAIRLALYGRHYDINNDSDDYISSINKPNGSPLSTGIFTNNSYKEISGVFFSTLATTGKFRALSDEPLCLFDQLRYDDSSPYRKHQIDCRINGSDDEKIMALSTFNIYVNNNQMDYESALARPRNPLMQIDGYTEKIAEGLHLYLNPFASHPIPDTLVELFKKQHIIIHSFNTDSKQEEFINLEDGYLIQRKVLVIPKH